MRVPLFAVLFAAILITSAPREARCQFQQPFKVFTDVGIINTPENKRALAGFDWGRPTVLDRDGFVNLSGFVGTWFGQRTKTGDMAEKWPVPGPHNFDDAELGKHQAQVREDVRRTVPQGFTGVVCIDYEGAFCWSQATKEQREAWEARCRRVDAARIDPLAGQERQDFLRDSFNDSMRGIMTATLRSARLERPAAKFGFYCQPPQDYWSWFSPDKAEQLRRINDTELAWLWQAVDVVFPSVYPFYKVVPEPVMNRNFGEQTLAACERYISANVLEGLRVAAPRRLPVYVWIWWRYHPNGNPDAENKPDGYEFVGDAELNEMFSLPKALGANGVVLYDYLHDPHQVKLLQEEYSRRILPILRDMAR